MVNYVVEYKKMTSPYSYEYYCSANGNPKIFKSISEARKACISLISRHTAVLAVVRGNNKKQQLVYATIGGGYVLEDRQGSISYWCRLNKNGTLGNAIWDIKSIGIIQSASQRW